jgi:serine/threonine protein kinase
VGADIANLPSQGSEERIGPYKLLARIGEGGMGEGWLAVRVDLPAQRVFLKLIHAKHRVDPEHHADYIRRFHREATIVASLRNQNIVLLLEADPEGRYLAFELIDGVDLDVLLRNHPDHRLPVDLAVYVMCEALKGLAHAHGRTSGGKPRGVVHRDLTPGNILISYAGEVKIADFGVAAVIRDEGEKQTSIVGKPAYQSPEEAQRLAVDGRSDIFALGVTAYRMLTGERPFRGSRLEIARAIAAGRFKPLCEAAPDVPPKLAEVIERMLSPEAADRPQTASEARDAIVATCAPPPLGDQALGLMVERAKPRRTLEMELTAAEPPTDELPTRRRNPTEPLTLPSAVVVAEMSEVSSAAGGVEVARNDHERSRASIAPPHLSRRWLALGIAGLAIAGVSTTLLTQRPHTTDINAAQAAPATQIQPPPEATSPPASAGTVTQPSPLSPEPTLELPAEPTITREQPTPPAAETTKPGTLRVTAIPQAQVFVDGKPKGWTHWERALPPGRYTISIGYDDQERPETRKVVTIKAGKIRRVDY